MLRLYDFLPSGNGYKVRLLLCQLEIPFERVELDILQGQTRTAAFLRKNPNGRIPVLRLEDGSYLAESNAILWYLAGDTPLLPASRRGQAQVLQWMFFEQYSHEPYIATSRFYRSILREPQRYADELARRQPGGYAALDVMERHLSGNRFFVGGCYTVADIALYAYTHVAAEGGFELERYPAVRAWLDRVALEPQHISITESCGAPIRE